MKKLKTRDIQTVSKPQRKDLPSEKLHF